MKKVLSLLLVLVLCASLFACAGANEDKNVNETEAVITKDEEGFNKSKEAFDLVSEAYIETNKFSEDIYEAWFQGVHNKSDFDKEYELSYFADEMHIDLASIEQAIANLSGGTSYVYTNYDWEYLPKLYNGSYFSAWVSVISEAYKCSGKADEIREMLVSAKALMKELSDEFSDYEHYPSLKKFFTNELAFFDFCCNPEGSFEQVVSTFNDYRNVAREYFFDLNYVFEDSIGGLDEYGKQPASTEETLASEASEPPV